MLTLRSVLSLEKIFKIKYFRYKWSKKYLLIYFYSLMFHKPLLLHSKNNKFETILKQVLGGENFRESSILDKNDILPLKLVSGVDY